METIIYTSRPEDHQPSELKKAVAAELKNLFPQETMKPQLQKAWSDHFYITMAGDLISDIPENLKLDLVEGKLSLSVLEEEKKEGFEGFIDQATKIFSDINEPPALKEVFEGALSGSSWRLFFTGYENKKI